jgi:uncharacterized membrane protein YcaP (DUF421 family)
MWKNLTELNLPALNLATRAVLVYLAVLLLLRISGKRQVGQMGAVEFVTILLISNAVQNSMNGGDNSLVGGLILATMLIVMSSGLAWLSYRSRVFEAIFEGTPRLLIHDGKMIEKALGKELLSKSNLRVLLRKQGVHRIGDVKSAVLEADGSLSLIRFDELSGSEGHA